MMACLDDLFTEDQTLNTKLLTIKGFIDPIKEPINYF